MSITNEVPINLRGALFMEMIIGFLGAVMEVVMSVSYYLKKS